MHFNVSDGDQSKMPIAQQFRHLYAPPGKVILHIGAVDIEPVVVPGQQRNIRRFVFSALKYAKSNYWACLML